MVPAVYYAHMASGGEISTTLLSTMLTVGEMAWITTHLPNEEEEKNIDRIPLRNSSSHNQISISNTSFSLVLLC
jgi:hypothetical protein